MVARLTFRDKQSGKAWQRLIREQAESRYASKEWWRGVDLSLKRAVVRPTARAIAEKIILEYEWLGTLPAPCSRFYGIFFDGWACGGVCCFADGSGGGANMNSHAEFGITASELSYLARGACTHWTPSGAGSKLIAHALRIESAIGKKVAIAYSDTDAGEIGTLYQATNWLCLGRGGVTTQFVHPKTGRIYDQKMIYDLRRRFGLLDRVTWTEMRDYVLAHGWKTQVSNAKYRYAYVLAKGAEHEAIMRRLAGKVTDYPKRGCIMTDEATTPRATSIANDAPDQPTGNEGGVTPTVALPPTTSGKTPKGGRTHGRKA